LVDEYPCTKIGFKEYLFNIRILGTEPPIAWRFEPIMKHWTGYGIFGSIAIDKVILWTSLFFTVIKESFALHFKLKMRKIFLANYGTQMKINSLRLKQILSQNFVQRRQINPCSYTFVDLLAY
jgi:hypothetical protein